VATVIERSRVGDDGRSPLADPSSRLGAVVVDALVPAVPHIVLMPIGVLVRSATWIHASMWLGAIALALYFVVNLVLLSRHGQTFGKRVFGIRIVRTDGTRATLARIFWLRAVVPGLVAAIPLVGSVFELADMLTIFGAERRTIHDRIADTIVIDLRAPLTIEATADVFR
jgi:uncharacterized RDD family membrane protein YckC